MSDYIWVMINGEVELADTVENVKNSEQPNVRSFIGEKLI